MSSIPSLAPRFYSATVSRERERERMFVMTLCLTPHVSGQECTQTRRLLSYQNKWRFIKAKTPDAVIYSTGPMQLTEPWPTVRHWHPDRARRKGGCLLLNKKRGLPKQPRCRDTLCSFPLLGPISHGKYFHNRASSSSLPALDLRLQYKQFWVKAEGRARCGK